MAGYVARMVQVLFLGRKFIAVLQSILLAGLRNVSGAQALLFVRAAKRVVCVVSGQVKSANADTENQ